MCKYHRQHRTGTGKILPAAISGTLHFLIPPAELEEIIFMLSNKLAVFYYFFSDLKVASIKN